MTANSSNVTETLQLVARQAPLFARDIAAYDESLREELRHARCLVIGGAGTIGQSVARELFVRDVAVLHVVDISENNMVELVRDIRSTTGYANGEFRTYAIDCGSAEFEALLRAEKHYDYVFNLSALKHVRSEKDPFTLMRMINVNIFNTISSLRQAKDQGAKKYFCVSTDKAANPVNMMGASKRIMELFLLKESVSQVVSMARFANVAFSDGSLLHGFNQRFLKRQPIAAPNDVRRYFVTEEEAGELCLLSAVLGENRDIFFPKLSENLNLTTFAEIARRYVSSRGYEPYECSSEDEARERASELISSGRWPCYFFESDTTGEKGVEEFYTEDEDLDLTRFNEIGVIRQRAVYDELALQKFLTSIRELRERGAWTKSQLVDIFGEVLPGFTHLEKGKYLDERM